MSLDEKRAAAIAWLGNRWLLHSSHAPQRRDAPTVTDRIRAGLEIQRRLAESVAHTPPEGVEWEIEEDGHG